MMRSIHLFCLCLLLAPATGAETVPKPRQKPAGIAAVQAAAIPIPRPNPRRQEALPPPDSDNASDAGDWPASVGAEALALCRSSLAGLDLAYQPLPAIGRASGCGVAAPIELTEIAGIALNPPATINCSAARALHDWVTTGVQPAAKRRLKTQVTEIRVAASYVCRLRNNAKSGKLSEHARGNAVDMSGFTFAKSDSVAVGGSWGSGLLASIGLSKSGSFLGDIREAACGHFTTVLGPGSDPYHGDHFHVDVIERRGGYRICK